MENFAIVENKTRHAVHGLFYSREGAEEHLKIKIPVYVERRYFTDKTLTARSFRVVDLRLRRK